MGIQEVTQSITESSIYDFRTVLHEEVPGFVERNGPEVLLKWVEIPSLRGEALFIP